MMTHYLHLYRVRKDEVWGGELQLPRTQLLRVTRNRLKKACWEWVGCNQALSEADVASLKAAYPAARRIR